MSIRPLSVLENLNYAEMSREEKIAVLTEKHQQHGVEFAQLTEGMVTMAGALRTMGMPESQIWATLVVTASDELGLNLDDDRGVTIAGMLASYQSKRA